MGQIGKNMLHVGRLGTLMFDDRAREAIRNLDLASARDSIVSPEQIKKIKPNTTLNSLSQEKIDHYHATEDFQVLLNTLSAIALATYQNMEPKQATYRVKEPAKIISGGAFGIYLFVPIKESPNMEVVKYLASSAPVPTEDGWPGNPIGNLGKSWEPLHYLLNGKSFVDDRLYTDVFYTSLSACVPILNKDGSTLALLGIDYAATEERNKLSMLGLFCIGLVACSIVLSIVSSSFMAKKLSASLVSLSDAAKKVAANDFSVSVDLQSNDEFATLGKVFNQMIASIRRYMQVLDDKHKQLATVICDMHDGVGSLLTSIAASSQKLAESKAPVDPQQAASLRSINHLAREGLTEVRFLVNALEYKACDYSTLLEEIAMMGADILTPSHIELTMEVNEKLPDGTFSFRDFLEIQRVFREIFVNIVKHSNATRCTLVITVHPETVTMHIQDNGTIFQTGKSENGSGHGLSSMQNRIKRLGGTFSCGFDQGFHIHCTLPNLTKALDYPGFTS